MPSPVLQFKRGALANVPGLRAGEPALTTDTYDLFVGIDSTTNNNKFFGSHRYWTRGTASTGSGVNFVEGTTNGSQYITLKAADSLSGITTFVLPTADGTNGQVLKTDGSGNLSFVSVASTFSIAGDTGFDDFTGGGTLTFAGTASEIETTVTDNQVQIGLRDNVVVGASLTVTSNLTVTGTTTLNGNVTLGNNSSDDINVGGEFVSNLIPNVNDQYDLGSSGQRWRNGWFAGNLNVAGILTATQYNDLLIANKDIVTGYIDGSSETDDTANHGGLAVASNEGNPLVDLALVGYNTLPRTYKQIMWVKGGSMGAGTTDAWLFNYAVGVGSTQVPNGVRFAVGSIQFTDTQASIPTLAGVTTVDATTKATLEAVLGSEPNTFTNLYVSGVTTSVGGFVGDLTGNASTATYATNSGISTQVKTVTASNNPATYYVTFVDANNGSATEETVYTDDGIYYNPGANKLTTQHAEFTGDVLVSGITTLTGNVNLGDSGTDIITVTGIATFPTSNVYINNSLYVGGLEVTGGASIGLDVVTRNLQATGITTLGTSGSDTLTVNATATFGPSITGTISTATRATTVDTTATSTNATYYVPFVDTFGGQTGETIRVGAGLSLNPSDGSVNTTGILGVGKNSDLTSYIKAGTGSNALYLYDNGDVSFQAKAIVNEIRSANNSTTLITLNGLDATFANNVTVTGITTSTGGFVGGLTGNVTGNVNSSGLSTFSSINVASINSSLGVSALSINGAAGHVTANNNLTVQGDLYVNGTTTQINTKELTVNDRTITLGIQTGATSSTTTWDLAVLMNYGDAGVAKTAGVIWDYSVERFVFSANSDNPASEYNTTTPVITVATHAPIEIASLWVNDCAGQSQVISCTGSERFLENITVDAGTF